LPDGHVEPKAVYVDDVAAPLNNPTNERVFGPSPTVQMSTHVDELVYLRENA
jgi:hypothetical protein